MSTSDDSLARFIEITSTSPSQAQFYLDSAGGDLDAAVAQFFESGGNDDAAVGSAELPGGGGGASAGGQSAPAPAPAAPQQSGAYTLSGAPVEGLPAGWGSSGGGGSGSGSGSGRSTPRNPLRSNAGPRITGFRDLASSSSGPSGGGRGGGDSDDEEGGRRRDPQQFFAGGARSGLSVENPNNNNNNQGGGGVNDMIQGLLQRATEGSQRLASRRAQEEEEQARPQFFGGSAHTLGSDETPSTYIPDPTRSSGSNDEDEEEEEEEQETAIRHLTFWQDGFSVEDGDLLKYEENQELLAAIQSGRAPLSLLNVRFDQPVELRIAERRNERWVRQPPPPQGPFAGSGNRLGSASPFPDSGAAAASSSEGAGTMPGSFGGAEKAGATGGGGGESAGGETVFEVDRNEPTTQVQIRLRSGERMIATFNHTHTVGDIRRYINASSPSNALQSYVLQTTFPSRDLTDENQTIKEAGVAGSVVVQRPV